MTGNQPMELCDNGRRCGAGKVPPCDRPARHWITWGGGPPIKLCEPHFQQAFPAITEPYLSKAEFDRRERERLANT